MSRHVFASLAGSSQPWRAGQVLAEYPGASVPELKQGVSYAEWNSLRAACD